MFRTAVGAPCWQVAAQVGFEVVILLQQGLLNDPTDKRTAADKELAALGIRICSKTR